MDFRMRDMGAGKASLYRANIGLFPATIFHSQPFPLLLFDSPLLTAQKEAIFFDFRTESCILEAIRFFIFLLLSYEVY